MSLKMINKVGGIWSEEYDGTLESIPEEYRLSVEKESLIDRKEMQCRKVS